MIPKMERYTDTLKQALARQRQKIKHGCLCRKGRERKRQYTNACGKERTDHQKCLWQRKKDQTTNAGGKEKWLP